MISGRSIPGVVDSSNLCMLHEQNKLNRTLQWARWQKKIKKKDQTGDKYGLSSQARVSPISHPDNNSSLMIYLICNDIPQTQLWLVVHLIWNKAALPGAQFHNYFSQLKAYSWPSSLLTEQNRTEPVRFLNVRGLFCFPGCFCFCLLGRVVVPGTSAVHHHQWGHLYHIAFCSDLLST